MEINMNEEERLLSEYIINKVSSITLGRATSECIENHPRDIYFIGNLRPYDDSQDTNELSHYNDLMNKLSPMSFGAEFRVEPINKISTINVTLTWSCYYRIFPTFKEQYRHFALLTEDHEEASKIERVIQNKSAEESNEEDETEEVKNKDSYSQSIEEDRKKKNKDSLLVKFRKITCQAVGKIVIRQDNGAWKVDYLDIEKAIEKELQRAAKIAVNDNDRLKTKTGPNDRIKVPTEALENDRVFTTFVRSFTKEISPEWSWRIDTEVINYSPDTNQLLFILQLTNDSKKHKESDNVENYLFDTKLHFEFNDCKILPFEIETAPKGFRYDRFMWGRGFNCELRDLGKSHLMFETDHIPVHYQYRYSTKNVPKAYFSELSKSPMAVLEDIEKSMVDYLDIWQQERLNYTKSIPDWKAKHEAEFDKDFEEFKSQIERFREGKNLIKNDHDVALSFKLTNETFYRAGQISSYKKDSWRLFQLVFLVSQIPDIAVLKEKSQDERRKFVDIVYFPTGGGKTEAYLGVVIFHIFFDRLRGKTAGVTAWTRFPLKLLTLQQTQRMADIVGMAELVRREQTDNRLSGEKIDGFAVGYFVGKDSTPNKLIEPQYGFDADWSKACDDKYRQSWKRVVKCPSCGTNSVKVDFDQDKVRLIHRCTNNDCKFPDGIIPVYIVDNEIYRYLPTVMVGTIDKLAGVGNERKISQVFGNIDGKCEKHGYYKSVCCQKHCTSKLIKGKPRGISGPTLFIQDELHLLKEGLGTFDSHYETFAQRLLKEFGQTETLKVIASSATVEAFERQVEHLYGRDREYARIFPGQGPSLASSFYADTLDYPQRLFVGLLPHNKTLINAVLELIEYYHTTVYELKSLPDGSENPYGGLIKVGSKEWIKILDLYSTSLTYFLANRDLDNTYTDIVGDVNPNLKRNGYVPLNISELTGNTTSDDMANTLERLQEPRKDGNDPDTILATSTVSHGVDIDRLNGMIFYGMPKQNAEYIQASSRVGRSHVGIVFICFHPSYERDQSHYAYFNKYHEYLGQMIEPVAINRWSKFSIQRTLPGLFIGILLQIMANRDESKNSPKYYFTDYIKKQISEGKITAEDFIEILEDTYLVNESSNAGAQQFKEEIRAKVKQFFDFIITTNDAEFVSDALYPPPMTSLREVDERIYISIDENGKRWGKRE